MSQPLIKEGDRVRYVGSQDTLLVGREGTVQCHRKHIRFWVDWDDNAGDLEGRREGYMRHDLHLVGVEPLLTDQELQQIFSKILQDNNGLFDAMGLKPSDPAVCGSAAKYIVGLLHVGLEQLRRRDS